MGAAYPQISVRRDAQIELGETVASNKLRARCFALFPDRLKRVKFLNFVSRISRDIGFVGSPKGASTLTLWLCPP